MSRKRYIYNIVPSVASYSSGPSYSVVRFVHSLSNNSAIRLMLISLSNERQKFTKGQINYTFFSYCFGLKRFGFSLDMLFFFLKLPKTSEKIVHIHSLWMWPVLFPGFLKGFKNYKLVISPRGSLSPWSMKNGHFVKKIVWMFFQKKVIKNADLIHATSKLERDEIRSLGFRNPIVIVPNGIDGLGSNYKVLRETKVVLFLGRIHKKKGLDILLRSWKEVSTCFPDWILKIVGPDDGYADEVNRLILDLSLENVFLLGEQIGENKYLSYGEAEIFVLPTYSENFGMTVAEALMVGTPVIVSKGAPWADVVTNNCGLWEEISVESFSKGLEKLMAISTLERYEMGLRGREWMIRDFSWEKQGMKFDLVYEWLFSGQLSETIFLDDV
jgi:glycosyltransferase involved in cell wall biosynthesis